MRAFAAFFLLGLTAFAMPGAVAEGSGENSGPIDFVALWTPLGEAVVGIPNEVGATLMTFETAALDIAEQAGTTTFQGVENGEQNLLAGLPHAFGL